MNPVDILDFLNELETGFPVDQWSMDGIHFWPLIRENICQQLDDFSLSAARNHKQSPGIAGKLKSLGLIFRQLAGHADAYFSDYRHNEKTGRRADIVFLGHSPCRTLTVGSRKYDIFFGPFSKVMQSMNLSSTLLEYSPGGDYRIPRFEDSRLIQADLVFLAIRNALSRRMDFTFTGKESFEEFILYMRKERPDIELPGISAIQKNINMIRMMANYFKKLLKKIGPKAGFVVNCHGNEGRAFVIACRELRIMSIDIQHGYQGSLHLAYSRWLKVPGPGFEFFPDIFWCWSEDEVGPILEWSSKLTGGSEAIAVGNLYLKMFLDGEEPIVKDFDAEVLRLRKPADHMTHVLVTLQTARGVPDLFRKAISASSDSCYWWIRLHPNMTAEREKIRSVLNGLDNRHINLDAASDLPLYSILRHIDVHLTEASCTVIEAAFFGVPSVIVNESGASYFQRYISEGRALAAYTPEETLKAIKLLSRKKADGLAKVKCFFPEGLDRIVNMINDKQEVCC